MARTPHFRGTLRASAIVSSLDLKLALRMLVRYPGLTVVGGLGIAVAVAIVLGFFAVFQARFYPVIPLSEGDRLVGLENWNRQTGREERRALHDFAMWRTEMTSVEDLTAFRTVSRNVIDADGSTEVVQVAEITPSGFRLARVSPLLGRSLVEKDAARDAEPVVVIGFDVWRSRFASAPDVVGRSLRLGDSPHTIVGVMPDGFAFPVNHRLWIPFTPAAADYERGKGPAIFIAGRLARGYDIDAANAEIALIGRRSAAALDSGLQVRVVPLADLYRVQRQGLSTAAAGIGVALLSVIFLATAGIYALMSFTIVQRRREIAIRTALGAQASRLLRGIFGRALRQIALGVALGVGATIVIDRAAEGEALQGRAGLLLSSTVLLIGTVGVCAALGPARRGLRIEPSEALKAE